MVVPVDYVDGYKYNISINYIYILIIYTYINVIKYDLINNNTMGGPADIVGGTNNVNIIDKCNTLIVLTYIR